MGRYPIFICKVSRESGEIQLKNITPLHESKTSLEELTTLALKLNLVGDGEESGSQITDRMKIPENIKLASLIHKPRNGFRINWVLNSGLKISISVGVLGAVGVFLVIKVQRFLELNFLDQDVASPRFWVVPGLQNLGNNCFLNVVLQALASCSSFRKYLRDMMEEYGSLSVEGGDENLPLVSSLSSLVEELRVIRHKRTVLSPRKLMLAMNDYVSNFNLARQQDAEEALSHVLSSLREEISEHCVVNKSCLADLPAQNRRILSTKSSEELNEWRRWKRSFLRPFDGILGSILICQSCSFQISLDFQLFHSLHLSPPVSSDGTIMAGCTLEDCLKRFFVAEHVENYCCSNCWHTGAVKYVSAFAEAKRDIEKLQRCDKNDSCECKALSSVKAFPFSNSFSRTFKQLSIAQSPKILCIHLQRASYNVLGQSVKLSGHVSFPLILDLSSFMNTGVGIKTVESNLRFGPLNRSIQEIGSFPHSKYQIFPRSISPETGVAAEQERNTIVVENGPRLEASEASLLSSKRSADGNENVIFPSARKIYRLVSVVVHYGTTGSGHYTVYRKVTGKIGDEDDGVSLLESAVEQWFCISDSEVDSVPEKDVLAANATMLFYEKIDNS